MEITENGIVYTVYGDYPDGKYVKVVKNSGTPDASHREKALTLLQSVDRQQVLSTDLGKVLAAVALLVLDIDAEDIGQ